LFCVVPLEAVVDFYLRRSTHYIGGEYLSRARRGDPGAPNPLTPVPRSEEVRAFANLDAYVFGAEAWRISPMTLRPLTYSEYEPMADLGYHPTQRHDLSLADIVAKQQNAVLGLMFAPLTLPVSRTCRARRGRTRR
jgi:hypothetical protein